MEKQKILIIDHDPRVLSTLAGFLRDEPYDVFTAENRIEGLEILKREPIHLVVADRGAEGHDGIILLKRVKAENIQIPILIMGEVAPMELTEEILRAGAVSMVNKPIEKNRFWICQTISPVHLAIRYCVDCWYLLFGVEYRDECKCGRDRCCGAFWPL